VGETLLIGRLKFSIFFKSWTGPGWIMLVQHSHYICSLLFLMKRPAQVPNGSIDPLPSPKDSHRSSGHWKKRWKSRCGSKLRSYVRVYVYRCIDVYTYIYINIHIIHTYIYNIHMYLYTHLCINTYMYTHPVFMFGWRTRISVSVPCFGTPITRH
jgi:hypothetical protein